MDESITVRISGNSTSLTSTFSPVINVPGGSEIALVSLQLLNISLTNDRILINNTNNTIRIVHEQDKLLDIQLPEKLYTVEDINNYICNEIGKHNTTVKTKIYFNLILLGNKPKCRISCNYDVHFNVENSLAKPLGFEQKIFERFKNPLELFHQSEKINYEIITNSIKVKCNITKGSFDNGQQSHSIYEYFPQNRLNTEVVESPINLIYYQLKTLVIKTIKIDLVDQNNNPITYLIGQVTVILHNKSQKS